ncbi:hypothetical protein WN55_08334 [Dufourea novaeangliae]|uniref:Uncharacterized protein n=1 Tax=Dufourea novaeangliae TaxID=178035 RepID=A0A154P6W1_DUFNO|nr:hypothetical protein WN55_08334 [Dufourea novaeangliae]
MPATANLRKLKASSPLLQNHPDESVPVNIVRRHENTGLRDNYQRFNDYADMYAPETLQKLRRLKELQMKRDINERYYSQEIKRLIGEYYFAKRMPSPLLRPQGKMQSASFQHHPGHRARNNIEPCGTMTTITRLDCGCIQETSRPIFTTARGRVQRRNCSQSQDEVLLKLTSSSPREHLSLTIDPRNDRQQRVQSKNRCTYEKITPNGDGGFVTETENGKQSDDEEQKIERVRKNGTPNRKFSDTSATTIH